MTDDDREVEPRSNKECRALANQAKEYYGNRRRWPVDIRRVLASGKILTVSEEKKLIYEVVDDSVLGDKDARTTQEGDAVKITAKYTSAALGKSDVSFLRVHGRSPS